MCEFNKNCEIISKEELEAKKESASEEVFQQNVDNYWRVADVLKKKGLITDKEHEKIVNDNWVDYTNNNYGSWNTESGYTDDKEEIKQKIMSITNLDKDTIDKAIEEASIINMSYYYSEAYHIDNFGNQYVCMYLRIDDEEYCAETK